MFEFQSDMNETIHTPTAAAALIAFRRKSIEGDEENAASKTILPSPRREPLRPLQRNNNSRESLFSSKDESVASITNSNSKPPLIRTPLKTPNSTKAAASTPLTAGRTPNAGKILSPLPLQPRKLKSAQKAKVKIDTEDFLSRAPCVPTPTEGSCVALDSVGGSTRAEDDILDLKLSKPFDEDESDDEDDSLGWAYTIDDFKFLRKLGSGGSADVYEVLEKGTCALYALKVQCATEDALCELDMHIPLKHENICQMFDYFYVEGRPFMDQDPEAIDRGEDPMTTRYLCTILESCDHGDIHDLIDEHVAVPEDIAAKVRISFTDFECILCVPNAHDNSLFLYTLGNSRRNSCAAVFTCQRYYPLRYQASKLACRWGGR